MGRGDKRTRKGKIFQGSSGNTRSKKKKPVNPLAQPDPNKVAVPKSDSIKKLADARPAPSEKKPVDKKPVDKKPVEKKAAEKKPADKKPAEAKKEAPKAKKE